MYPLPIKTYTSNLGCIETRVFSVRLLHEVAFSMLLSWLSQTKVITLKTQTHAVNPRLKKFLQLVSVLIQFINGKVINLLPST